MRIQETIGDCVRRRSAGEDVSDTALISTHPDLMPELGEELKKLALIRQARDEADGPPRIIVVPAEQQASPNGHTAPPEGATPTILGEAFAIPGYRIVGELGRGGMGVVYDAVQEKLGRRVALKILPATPGATRDSSVARFRREATAAANLHHTNIVPVYDYGETGHAYFYAMELIEGIPLTELLRRLAEINAPSASQLTIANILPSRTETADPTQDAESDDPSSQSSDPSSISPVSGSGRVYYKQLAKWMADAADALHYAHSKKIVHRDIKPANLILSQDGRIMILDFGLAMVADELSVTVTGSVLGTLRYMSPEQAMAKRMNVDHRSDIFSLGATIYEFLTFRPAFQGRDQKETFGMIVTRDPTSPRKIAPSIPREFETICMKCLEKDPGARYGNARALAEDLRRFRQNLPIVARPVGPVGKVIKLVRRRPWVALASMAVVSTNPRMIRAFTSTALSSISI